MERECFKCGSDCEKPGYNWFVRGHKLYFCAICGNILENAPRNYRSNLLADFLSPDWAEKFDVGPEMKNIIESRMRRSRERDA